MATDTQTRFPIHRHVAVAGEDDDWLPTRETLLSRLRQWDEHASWQEFFDLYWRLIYGVCRRFGLNDAESRDVTQDTIIAVSRQLPNFRRDQGRGAFKTWLYAVTRNKIVDHYRKAGRLLDTISMDALTPEQSDALTEMPSRDAAGPNGIWEEEWQRNLLDAATVRVKAKVSPKQYQIFDLYVNRRWPTAEVMNSLEVSRTQVFLAKHRVTKLLKEEAARLVKEWEKGS